MRLKDLKKRLDSTIKDLKTLIDVLDSNYDISFSDDGNGEIIFAIASKDKKTKALISCVLPNNFIVVEQNAESVPFKLAETTKIISYLNKKLGT